MTPEKNDEFLIKKARRKRAPVGKTTMIPEMKKYAVRRGKSPSTLRKGRIISPFGQNFCNRSSLAVEAPMFLRTAQIMSQANAVFNGKTRCCPLYIGQKQGYTLNEGQNDYFSASRVPFRYHTTGKGAEE
jgi:hypothetical protein